MKKRYGLDWLKFQKKQIIFRILLAAVIFVALVFSSIFFYKFFTSMNRDSISTLYRYWNLHTQEGYSKVYEISQRILQKKHLNSAVLTLHGYSAFMLSQSEIDNAKAQEFLDDSIFSLRIALQCCKKNVLLQIQYMLGRAYFYKNKLSSYHYYADLVVQYLESAFAGGYKSDDIPLLLGLSYASLGESEKSIAAFTEALLVRESDTLLFNIAKQYFNNEQKSVAKQYLFRVINMTEDEELLLNSRYLLGQIYTEEEDFNAASGEFSAILEKNPTSADAYYGLGALYEKQGDIIKARAQWRKCLKLQYNHTLALKKMS